MFEKHEIDGLKKINDCFDKVKTKDAISVSKIAEYLWTWKDARSIGGDVAIQFFNDEYDKAMDSAKTEAEAKKIAYDKAKSRLDAFYRELTSQVKRDLEEGYKSQTKMLERFK